MSQNNDAILLHVDGAIATITLNRPERHNALEKEDMLAFIRALDVVEAAEGVRVLIVTGRGEKTFCAGASLKQLMNGDFESNVYERLTERLNSFPLPTLCALNGSAYGGGVEIALCCDLRIGVRDSKISVPPARLGLCYPPSGLKRFVFRLGLGAAKRILMSSETLDDAEMRHIGFVDYLVDRADLAAKTAAVAERLAGLAPLAVQGMKRLINQIGDGSYVESEAQAIVQRCLESADLQEGLRAQMEKRPPRFAGR